MRGSMCRLSGHKSCTCLVAPSLKIRASFTLIINIIEGCGVAKELGFRSHRSRISLPLPRPGVPP